ncbi:MAG: cytochrome b6-f complex subunit PetL [Cyanobacteria bacterium P01_D01_bin.71]
MSIDGTIAFVILLGGGVATAMGLYFGLRAAKVI